MVARNYHERFKNDALVAARLDCFNDIVYGRLCFDRADIVILEARFVYLVLELFIGGIGSVLRAVSHEYNSCLAVDELRG